MKEKLERAEKEQAEHKVEYTETGFAGLISKENCQIFVEVLDRRFSLDDFTFESLEVAITSYELGGIADPVGQLSAWLWEQISGALKTLENTVWGFLITIRDTLWIWINEALTTLQSALASAILGVKMLASSIYDTLTGLASAIANSFSQVVTFLEGLGVSLVDIASVLVGMWEFMTQIPSLVVDGIRGFIDALSGLLHHVIARIGEIPGLITGFFERIRAFIENIGKTIAGAFTQFYGFLTDVFVRIMNQLSGVGASIILALQTAFQTVGTQLVGFGEALTSFFESLVGQLINLAEAVKKGFDDFLKGFGDMWAKVQLFFKEQYAKLVEGFYEIGMTFKGFINPLVQITGWLANLPRFLLDLARRISDFFTAMWDGIIWVFDRAWEYLSVLAGKIVGVFSALTDDLISVGRELVGRIWDAMKGFGVFITERIFHPLVELFQQAFTDFLRTVDPRLVQARASISPTIVAPAMMRLMFPIMTMTQAMKLIEQAGEGVGETSLKLFGTGGKLGMAKLVKGFVNSRIGESLITGISMGTTMALLSPLLLDGLRVYARSTTRPLPPMHDYTLRAYSARFIDKQTFDKSLAGLGWWSDATDWLAKTSFTYLRVEEIARLYIFGEFNERKAKQWLKRVGIAPEALNYSIRAFHKPISADDVAVMFRKAKINADQAKRLFWMTEPIYDIFPGLKEKFLSHKVEEAEVPISLTDLIAYAVHEAWELVEQGVDWVTHPFTRPTYPYYLKYGLQIGFPRYWADLAWEDHWKLIAPERIADLFFWGVITKGHYLKYMQYHDYRPVHRPMFPATITTPWGETIEPSDAELMRVSLYDIPLRIDARWMARWGIAKIADVARIVEMRRMSPEWKARVISAEWVNNLMDERTRLVGELMKCMEVGLLTKEGFESIVKEYEMKYIPESITYKGAGGVDVTIRLPRKIWLLNPDEVIMNAMRVDWAIERDYVEASIRALEYLYVTGELTDQQLEEKLGAIIKVRRAFEARLIEIKARKIREQLYYTHREMLRFIDAVAGLYEEGFISREQAIERIKKHVGRILTRATIEMMIAESDYKLERTLKRYPVKAVIVRLRRGAITLEIARQELSRLIVKPELVDAILEAEAKIYTISIERLITMMEYMPIPENMFKQKIEAIGMPPDEAKLMTGYAFAREMAREVDAYWREIRKEYVTGLIDLNTLREELNWLVTLGGKVREWFGVDWLWYSPHERDMMIMTAERERARREALKRRS